MIGGIGWIEGPSASGSDGESVDGSADEFVGEIRGVDVSRGESAGDDGGIFCSGESGVVEGGYRSVINGLNGEGVGDIDGATIDVINGVEEGGITSEVLSEGNGPGGFISVECCGTNDFVVVVLIDNGEVGDGEGSGFTVVGVGVAGE